MQKIKAWLQETDYKDHALEIASEDASFRRYFRLIKGTETFILMDSSLEKESLKPFEIAQAQLECAAEIHQMEPEIHAFLRQPMREFRFTIPVR